MKIKQAKWLAQGAELIRYWHRILSQTEISDTWFSRLTTRQDHSGELFELRIPKQSRGHMKSEFPGKLPGIMMFLGSFPGRSDVCSQVWAPLENTQFVWPIGTEGQVENGELFYILWSEVSLRKMHLYWKLNGNKKSAQERIGGRGLRAENIASTKVLECK